MIKQVNEYFCDECGSLIKNPIIEDSENHFCYECIIKYIHNEMALKYNTPIIEKNETKNIHRPNRIFEELDIKDL